MFAWFNVYSLYEALGAVLGGPQPEPPIVFSLF
jgi:hypothetical protein